MFVDPVAATDGHLSDSPFIVTIAKVAGFLFCLLLFFSHVIELRFIEHNLNCVVPAQIIVFGENCADLLFQITRNFDLGCFEFLFRFFVYFAQLVAARGTQDKPRRAASSSGTTFLMP